MRGPNVNPPPPCGEKLLSRVTVRKGEYGVNTRWNCGWAWNHTLKNAGLNKTQCWVNMTEHILGCFQPTMGKCLTNLLGSNPAAGFVDILPSAGLYLTQHFLECMIALSAVARNSGPFALILLWGPLKITFSGGCQAPSEHRSGPSQLLGSQPLLHLLARLKPASSKNMNGFHQLPALSPSKKAFIVGKTNTENYDFEFLGIFFLPTTGILKLIIPEHTQSSVAQAL